MLSYRGSTVGLEGVLGNLQSALLFNEDSQLWLIRVRGGRACQLRRRQGNQSQSLASAAESSVSEKPHKTLFCAVSRRSVSQGVKYHLPGKLTGASAPRFLLGQA